MKLVFNLCRKYWFGQCVSAVGEFVSASQSGSDTSLCSQKVLKYADTNGIEFQSS